MSEKTLEAFLPKLKEGKTNENSVMLPVKLREWDNRQAETRILHLADAIEVPPGVENVHSIPDPWARVILFSRALRDADHPLHKRIVGEWRGMLAILGLKEILKFRELTASQITMDAGKAPANSFHYAVARTLPFADDPMSSKATWSSFYIFRWLGEEQKAGAVARAFAMTSPWTLVATGSYYADVLNASEVPWFVNGLLQDPTHHLNGTQRTALAEWILCVADQLAEIGSGPRHGDMARRLAAFARDLDEEVSPPEAEEILASSGIGLGGDFYKILNKPHKSESDLITSVKIIGDRAESPDLVLIDDKLPAALDCDSREISIAGDITLASAERHLAGLAAGETTGWCPQHGAAPALRWCKAGYFFQDDLIYEQPPMSTGAGAATETLPECRRVNMEGRSAGRHIALPLNEEIAQLFTARYLEENFQILWLDAGGAICRLRLKIQALGAAAEGRPPEPVGPVHEIVIEREYAQATEMIRVQKLPVICIWPNFRFDDELDTKNPLDGKPRKWNRWTKYFLFEAWQGGNKDEFVVSPLKGQQQESRMVREDQDYFQITVTNRFPEMLVCRMPFNRNRQRVNDNNPPKGLLLLQEPKALDTRHGRSAGLGIDFGTTGTSVYSASGIDDQDAGHAEKPARVNFMDRLFRVAVGYDPLAVMRATRDFFVPGQDWASGKILSVFQDFGASDDGTRAAIRDGHVLFAQDSKSYSFVTGTEASIKTNLKWGADRRENFAARDFLTQICIQSLAELVAGGATSVDVRYSYPTAFSDADIEHFDTVWKMVLQHVKTATGVPVTNKIKGEVNCEAVAATRFFAHSENAVRLNVYSGAVTLDIGGGTTDIAVWNRNPDNFDPALQAHLSILFAGRDIFLAPLRLRPDLLKLIDESKQMDGALAALGRVTKGSQAYYAAVDAIVSKYGDSLLENLPGVAREPEIKQFLDILELGLCGVAFYTGLLVGRLVQAGRFNPMQSGIPVFIGGNGSKLMRWCALGDARSESTAVRKFGSCLLAGANFASGQQFKQGSGNPVHISLSELPKEEVAFGLLINDPSPYRNSDFINPLPGENYYVGPASDREERDWSRSPDTETLRAKPVTVNRKLAVVNEFLKAMEIPFSESEAYAVADSIDRELGKMSRIAREAPARGPDGKSEDSVRKEPIFVIALKHLINDRVTKLVNRA